MALGYTQYFARAIAAAHAIAVLMSVSSSTRVLPTLRHMGTQSVPFWTVGQLCVDAACQEVRLSALEVSRAV